MHLEAAQWVARCVDLFGLDAVPAVLDLGGRNVNGTTDHLFHGQVVHVDIVDGPGVDIVADAADLNLDDRFGVVVSTECLEHTERAAEIVVTAHRHLTPGGVFVATMAGPGRAPHGQHGAALPAPDEFYRNVHSDELAAWLIAAGFGDFSVDTSGADVRCWARKD